MIVDEMNLKLVRPSTFVIRMLVGWYSTLLILLVNGDPSAHALDTPVAKLAEGVPLEEISVRPFSASDVPPSSGGNGGLYTGPYFDPYMASDVSVQAGAKAILPCRVRQAGNRSVSWIRKTDGHLVSVGEDMFINDGRFQAQRIVVSDTWALQIRSVLPSDSGDYECQVSSNEPKMSRIVSLTVIEPMVSIRGAPDVFVKSGSPVTLHCHISSFLVSPTHVEWRINGTLLSQVKNNPYAHQQQKRGKGESDAIVAGATDTAGRSTVLERFANDSILVLTLVLPNTSPEDSGQYSCAPSNMTPATISFHVVIGEHPAAMQHGDNSSTSSARPVPALVLGTSSLLLVGLALPWRCLHAMLLSLHR